jgi:hypothetical protein
VRDVLARERLLVRLRAHVARVDAVHAQLRLLAREDRSQLLEGGLRRAIAAPALVWLDRRIRGDVENGRPRGEPRKSLLDESERGEDVDVVDARKLRERVGGECGLRARAEHARVVDEQVDPTACRLDERSTMARVAHVARDRNDAIEVGYC